MSEAKHTPGPWTCKVEKRHVVVKFADGEDSEGVGIRLWGGEDDAAADAVAIATARLIAAAPALLAACELAQRWLANCVPVVDLDGPKPLPVLDAAIRLARGG